jgi:hypothetical protein
LLIVLFPKGVFVPVECSKRGQFSRQTLAKSSSPYPAAQRAATSFWELLAELAEFKSAQCGALLEVTTPYTDRASRTFFEEGLRKAGLHT